MSNCKGANIYRYIYKEGNGYSIAKNNEHYGYYSNLTDALFDRDRLDQVDWNMSDFVQLPETSNPYNHMHLPPFEKKPQYITHVKFYKVEKRINGKTKYFGSYKTLNEAIMRVEELIDNNWEE